MESLVVRRDVTYVERFCMMGLQDDTAEGENYSTVYI
jgi:hypothetical protein